MERFLFICLLLIGLFCISFLLFPSPCESFPIERSRPRTIVLSL